MSLEILLEAALYVERQTQGNCFTQVSVVPVPPRNKQDVQLDSHGCMPSLYFQISQKLLHPNPVLDLSS